MIMKKYLLPLLCLVALFGCSRNDGLDGLPRLVPVTLTITQEGVPLSDAAVWLSDMSGDVQISVGGTTNSEGTVVLLTHGLHRGAPLGKYKVMVMKAETVANPNMPPGSGETLYSLVARQYTQPDTTPLELDITESLTATFDVGKAVRERQ